VLQPIIESCTKDSISSGKSWIFQNASSPAAIKLLTEYLNFRVTSENSDFTAKLHLIYLVNDVLHHCVRKNNQELKTAFELITMPMYTAAACSADPEQMQKLTKLLTLWETKSKFFDDAMLSKLKNYEESYAEYRAELKAEFRSAVESVEETTRQTYEGYKAQHDQFVEHAMGQIGQHQVETERLQQQIAGLEAGYEEAYRNWQQQWSGAGGNGNRRSRWDKAAPAGNYKTFLYCKQCCVAGMRKWLDPDSVTLWIRIRIGNPDPDPRERKLRNFSERKLRNFSEKMHFLVIF
jgi:calcium homeostasis ER protein